eukprot:8627702-Pyramimonas_sp.AAC.1
MLGPKRLEETGAWRGGRTGCLPRLLNLDATLGRLGCILGGILGPNLGAESWGRILGPSAARDEKLVPREG